MKSKTIGDLGENAVCRYLAQNGYTIRTRNFRIRGGEIDIVASRGEELCFVEVKTRRAGSPYTGDEAVDDRKQQRIIRAAYAYCQQYGIDEEAWYIRYDIACADYWQGEILSIDYLENAFDESDFSW